MLNRRKFWGALLGTGASVATVNATPKKTPQTIKINFEFENVQAAFIEAIRKNKCGIADELRQATVFYPAMLSGGDVKYIQFDMSEKQWRTE